MRSNLDKTAQRYLLERGYEFSVEDYELAKWFDSQNALRVTTVGSVSANVSFRFFITRRDIVDLGVDVGLVTDPRRVCVERDPVAFAQRPKREFEAEYDSASEVIEYLDEWLPKVEELATLEFFRAFQKFQYDREWTHVGLAGPRTPAPGWHLLIADRMLDGWRDGDEELFDKIPDYIRNNLGDYQSRVAAWVAAHPDGVVRECVNPEGQVWADEQMELSARSGVEQWHEQLRAELFALEFPWMVKKRKPLERVRVVWPMGDLTFADVRVVLDRLCFIEGDSRELVMDRLLEGFCFVVEDFTMNPDTDSDADGDVVVDRLDFVAGVRLGVQTSLLGFVVELGDYTDFDEQAAALSAFISGLVGEDVVFSFNTKSEGVDEALLAFDGWLVKVGSGLRLYMVQTDNEQHVVVLHPEEHLVDSIVAFDSFGYDLKPLTPDLF